MKALLKAISSILFVAIATITIYPVLASETSEKYIESVETNLDGSYLEEDNPVYDLNIAVSARSIDFGRHQGFWHHSPIVLVRPFSFNPNWQTPINNAMSNWNTRNTPVAFGVGSASNNTVAAGSHTWNEYGVIYVSTSGTNITWFNIILNSRTISSSATNTGNFITSVMVHELGHVVGLRDNPTGVTVPTGSVMRFDRPRNSLVMPTAFDVASVNMLY